MGADFIFDTLPACKITKAREKVLKKILDDTPDEDFGDDMFDDMDKWLEAVAYELEAYPTMQCYGREVGVFFTDKCDYFITGGMSWGDAPTEAYHSFARINSHCGIITQLDKWGTEDKAKKRKAAK